MFSLGNTYIIWRPDCKGIFLNDSGIPCLAIAWQDDPRIPNWRGWFFYLRTPKHRYQRLPTGEYKSERLPA